MFCTTSHDAAGVGRPVNPSTVRESLKSYAKRAGITKRTTPHNLRHTHVSDLANEGVPTNVIRKQLGHEDLGMTQRYVDHLAPQDVLNALGAREWPGGAVPPATTRAATSQGCASAGQHVSGPHAAPNGTRSPA